MGLLFREHLSGPRIYCCSNCRMHAANQDRVYVKSYQGRFGYAYIFNSMVNVCLSSKERVHMTGLHTITDIHCSSCHQILGWRYEKAYEQREKYMEGKYIMERSRMVKETH